MFGLCILSIACENTPENETQKKLAEAKQIFDQEYSRSANLTKDPDILERVLYEGYRLQPGDFTPEWPKAEYIGDEVYVPIISEYNYFATLFKSAKDIYAVADKPVIQELIINISKETCSLSYSIPNPGSSINRKNFSGTVILTNLYLEHIRLKSYTNGIIIHDVNRESVATDKDFYDVLYNISGYHYVISRPRVIISRSENDQGHHGNNYDRVISQSQLMNILDQLSNGDLDCSFIFNNQPGSASINYAPITIDDKTITIRSLSIFCQSYDNKVNGHYTIMSRFIERNVEFDIFKYGPSISSTTFNPTMTITLSDNDYLKIKHIIRNR